MLRNIYGYRDVDPSEGIRPALPVGAQYEDWMWEVMATTRVMFRAIGEVRKRSQVSMLVRPGPWERHGSYDFLVEEIGNLRVVPFMLQHEYLRNWFATIDCYSTLGIESLLAGTPVISIVQLVARLEQHVGGVEGTRFDAPYRRYFWQPKDFAELVELVQRAERGELPVSPDPDGFRTFMRESYGWPGVRPASFETGDLLLRTLDSPRREIVATVAKSGGMRESIKLGIYRYVPGSTCVPTARVLCGYYFGVNRESMRRYHYLESFYPHHSSVRRLFAGLARRFDVR